MASTQPSTPPGRTGKELERIIEDLNSLGLQIPNPTISSPLSREKKTLEQRCFAALKQLHFNRKVDIYALIEEFKALVLSSNQWVFKPQQEAGTLPARDQFLRRNGYQTIPPPERKRRLELLLNMLDSTVQSVTMNEGSFTSLPPERSFTSTAPIVHDDDNSHVSEPISLKRKSVEDADVFQTAPSSPVMSLDESMDDTTDVLDPDWDDSIFDAMNGTDDCLGDAQKPEAKKKRQSTIGEYIKNVRKFGEQPAPPKQDVSFATTVESNIFDTGENDFFRNSFETNITEPIEENMTSSATFMISDEVPDFLKGEEIGNAEPQCDLERQILDELLQHGPFSKTQSFSGLMALRYRYELERIAQQWKIPYDSVFAGDRAPFSSYEKFWEWVKSHPQRGQNFVPEKSPIKAWNSAVGQFRVVDKHSEVVVLTGNLDWREKHNPGILNLTLNPLKIERSCRFHRRFGSDRFLSLTMPAPARPPNHLRFKDEPSVLRESIVKWLTKNEHHYLGRTWKPFYVDEVKKKSKKSNLIRFRVDFFAINGLDFDRGVFPPPPVAPINQPCDQHTAMSLDMLLDWHLLRNANEDQNDCKLFQRIALGLSKTWATVVLRPKEVLHLKDDKNKPIMNDGCALMSRALAREICDNMSLSGNTPSCFQGRIAGAKGLWMVDRQNSDISAGDRDFWIQVSDSQLKVKPHPSYWNPESVDDEQLTFEIAGWSKPLNQVGLNVQLLTILDYGGTIREHVADLMRGGIKQLYEDFAEVIKRDDILLGRCLLQKLKPTPEEGMSRNWFKRSDSWALDNVESAIRFLEAGFSPRNFPPLRERLRLSLESTLDRYVEDLHIHVPLSTYAFCIADPYSVLEEDEVHFGFSSQWQHQSFEDTLLDDMDVLVARLPAHLPSDVQRRRAVWRSELRHFKDVIVFPSRGTQPLADLLSGGDYDGDKPWICWDQGIVETFINSSPPQNKRSPEFFGLTYHATPMGEIQSTEDFLQRTFMFNLTLSNLGRCTMEHERLIYEEEDSVNSEKAKELAMLLGHLVDGRKTGVELSENAWLAYRKKISPRPRMTPAYKTQQKGANLSNIIDYLKFEVASREKEDALRSFERVCDELEAYNGGDPDLLRPWNRLWDRAIQERRKENGDDRLLEAVRDIVKRVEDCHDKWRQFCAQRSGPRDLIQSAIGLIESIQPPVFDHVLSHVWQESEHEWRTILASCSYKHNHSVQSKFLYYAMGETICRIKTGNAQSRLVKDEVYNILGVSSRVSRRILAREEERGDNDELEGDEAIDQPAYESYNYEDYDDDGVS